MTDLTRYMIFGRPKGSKVMTLWFQKSRNNRNVPCVYSSLETADVAMVKLEKGMRQHEFCIYEAKPYLNKITLGDL